MKVSGKPCCNLGSPIDNASRYGAVKKRTAKLEPAGCGSPCNRFPTVRRDLDINSKHIIPMTVSLPESSAPTTCGPLRRRPASATSQLLFVELSHYLSPPLHVRRGALAAAEEEQCPSVAEIAAQLPASRSVAMISSNTPACYNLGPAGYGSSPIQLSDDPYMRG